MFDRKPPQPERKEAIAMSNNDDNTTPAATRPGVSETSPTEQPSPEPPQEPPAIAADGDYKVGYGKPPRQHCFPKGKSGNPSGRPRKPKTMGDAFEKVMSQLVTVREGGKARRITRAEAMLTSVSNRVIMGNDLKGFSSLMTTARQGSFMTPTKTGQVRNVLVGPTKSRTIEEWERDHGMAARGEPPPEFDGLLHKPIKRELSSGLPTPPASKPKPCKEDK